MKTLTHMHTINSMRYLSLSVGTEDVCVTGLFWTPLCFYFCFTHVCVVWVCVSLLCVHTTRDSVCKKKNPSIYCLTSFLHGSTWLSHFNEEYIYIYIYLQDIVYVWEEMGPWASLSLDLHTKTKTAVEAPAAHRGQYREATLVGHPAVFASTDRWKN